MQTAAELIKKDIKGIAIPRDVYPKPDDISSWEQNSAFAPCSLKLKVFSEKKADLKIVSVGQSIEQTARRSDPGYWSRPSSLVLPSRFIIILQRNFL